MLENISHSALTETLTRNLGELYLGQARTEKKSGHLDVALTLYDQLKETLKSLGSVKEALRKAQYPHTLTDETLRTMMADAYFERGEVLEGLNLFAKARSSYFKAGIWGHTEAKHRVEASQSTQSGHSTQSSMPTLAQTDLAASMHLQGLPVASSAQEKGELVDYLFERALFTLGSLKVSNKPSIFLVYAHDNPVNGKAEASTSKYLINHLSKIQATLHSDQTPLGQPYSNFLEDLKEDGKLEDILTSQLCLLPAQVEKEVKPVNKVVVCCSEVLGNYLEWLHYKDFYLELRKAYLEDRETYRKDGERSGALTIRVVVEKFSQEEKYKTGFHHVLTEMAFLQIRAEELKDQHGIIPVSLTPNGSKQCLKNFISPTTVRIEDIPRFNGQALSPNQSRHWVLFKLIERLLVDSNEAKTFLDKFWQGYSDFIARLNAKPMLGRLEFAKQLDGIFDGIRTALHSQLFFTVQHHHQQLQMLNADPRSAIKEQYFDALEQDEEFEETLQLYVEPRGKTGAHEAEIFKLLPKIRAFLNDEEAKVILLTGDSGAGKTSFNRVLEKQLWADKKEHDAIPLFISLASIDNPVHDLISKALKKKGLSKDQIQRLKKEKQRFVFILDGYDEIRQTKNLYQSNCINQPGSWQGQMVISCRSEYLGQGQGYRKWFQPNQYRQSEARSFPEVVIEPFSEEERNQYLEKYVDRNKTIWAAQRYQQALEQPHLKDLVSNPFLLRVVLEVLPYLENEGKSRTAIQLRMDLYNQFVRQWFERNEQRLIARDLTEGKREIFREMCNEGFVEHGIEFVEDLAVHLYTKNAGNPVVEYSSLRDKGNWKKDFFELDDKKQLLREAWPLSRSGNQYRFVHKLLLEYFAARVLFESLDACMASDTRPPHGSSTSVHNFENEATLPSRTLRDVSLAPRHWIGDLGVVRLLTERVRQEAPFKEKLLAIVEHSKTDAGVHQAAANAITILVKSGMQLNSKNFNGIHVRGADLSFGVFERTQFGRADLSEVILRGSWLCGANMRGANLQGVEFGEMPALEVGGICRACSYSPNGRWLAVGVNFGGCKLYQVTQTQTQQKLELKYSLGGSFFGIRWPGYSVAFSSDSQWLASADYAASLRLWLVETGDLKRIFVHSKIGRVSSVVFSPDSQWLASASEDSIIKLWEIKTGELKYMLQGHKGLVNSVSISPDGKVLASGGLDKTVKLWELGRTEATLRQTLEEHSNEVMSVSFSLCGKWLASGGMDKTVKLWKLGDAGILLHQSLEQGGAVTSVSFSSYREELTSGCKWLASGGSQDGTVKLWDLNDSKVILAQTFEGHKDQVSSVSFLPDGKWLASGSWDKTIKLWDLGNEDGLSRQKFDGHSNTVKSVSISRDGKWLASGSDDKTVKLWKQGSLGLVLHQTFKEHSDQVRSVYISPDGEWLVSGGSDKTIKLRKLNVEGASFYRSIGEHSDEVNSVSISKNGKWLASGGSGNTIKLWNLETESSQTLGGHSAQIRSICISPDGEWLVSGSSDKTIKLWKLNDDRADFYQSIDVHSNQGKSYVKQLDSEVDYRAMAKLSGISEDTLVAIRQMLKEHNDRVENVSISPDGKWLASGNFDGTVRLWKLSNTGASWYRALKGHKWTVLSVSFSPDSKWLASGGWDGMMKLWSLDTGECKLTIQGFMRNIHSVAWQEYTENSAKIVMGGSESLIRIIQLESKGRGWKSSLYWTSNQNELSVADLTIKGVENLDPENKRLIVQRQRNANAAPSFELYMLFLYWLHLCLSGITIFIYWLDSKNLLISDIKNLLTQDTRDPNLINNISPPGTFQGEIYNESSEGEDLRVTTPEEESVL